MAWEGVYVYKLAFSFDLALEHIIFFLKNDC